MKTTFFAIGLLLMGLVALAPSATATHVCTGGAPTYSCYGVFPGFGPNDCTVSAATWTGVNNDGDWQDSGETLNSNHCVRL